MIISGTAVYLGLFRESRTARARNVDDLARSPLWYEIKANGLVSTTSMTFFTLLRIKAIERSDQGRSTATAT